ncbi:hypothetical protein Tco_0328662 [Tanacetum coccineum]
MGDSMQLFQQQFEAFMKRYSEDQQRIQSQFEEIRQENTHNSATREPRVNRLNEEGLDRGSGGTGNTNRRCKLDFPRYDGSTDPLPWMSRCDYYFRHQRVADDEDRLHMDWEEFKDHCRRRFGSYGSRSKLGEMVKLRQTEFVEYQRQFKKLVGKQFPLSPPTGGSLLLIIHFSSDSIHQRDSITLHDPELAEQRPERHESLTPSSEFPLAPVVAPPGIHRRPAILVRFGEVIPFGRPYHTHLNGPRKLLTTRKRVGPFPARRLAWRHVSHRQSHSGPSTRVASPRLVDSPVRTTQCSETYMHWRSAPLSTLYPLTTLESSLGSSSKRSLVSSSPSAGPSCKRCRSPASLVPSSTLVSRSIAPTLADLSPSKRFRDSYSFKVSGEDHMEMGIADAETVADLGISVKVRAPTEDGIDLGVKADTGDIREDEEEFEVEASKGGTMEIVVDPLATGDISDPIGGVLP